MTADQVESNPRAYNTAPFLDRFQIYLKFEMRPVASIFTLFWHFLVWLKPPSLPKFKLILWLRLNQPLQSMKNSIVIPTLGVLSVAALVTFSILTAQDAPGTPAKCDETSGERFQMSSLHSSQIRNVGK